MTLPKVTPGSGPPALPGVPYTFRGYASEGAFEECRWSATLLIAGTPVARVAQNGPDQPISMVFAREAEQMRFERFAAARAQRAGISDEEEMQAILCGLADACYTHRRVSKVASRATVFQVKGQPDQYFYLSTRRTPEVEAKVRNALSDRLDRILITRSR